MELDIMVLKNEIIDFVDIISAAVVKKQAPAQDMLTRRQADLQFDRKWIELQVKRNRIKGVRRGVARNSPIMFSRLELLALKEAERRGAYMVRK